MAPFTLSNNSRNFLEMISRKEVLNAAGPFFAEGPENIKNIGHVDVACRVAGTRVGSCWFVEMESSFHKSSTYQLLSLSPLSSRDTLETYLNLILLKPHRRNGKAKSR